MNLFSFFHEWDVTSKNASFVDVVSGVSINTMPRCVDSSSDNGSSEGIKARLKPSRVKEPITAQFFSS